MLSRLLLRRVVSCTVALLALCSAGASAQSGVVTIVEGEATVLIDDSRTRAAEGQRLGPGTIVETDATAVVLRIEMSTGPGVDLGPGTRVMLWPQGLGSGDAGPLLYVLQGWVKLSAPEATPQSLVTPALALRALKGVAVVWVNGRDTSLFLESGSAQLVERRDGKDAATLPLEAGKFYARSGVGGGTARDTPNAAMLSSLPRVFRDTLPSRGKQFLEGSGAAQPLPPASYAELQPWLDAEPALRRTFTRRFAVRARDPQFRRALVAGLAAHPEWRPVLFPPQREATLPTGIPRPEITVITRRPDAAN